MNYPDVLLCINGEWIPGGERTYRDVVSPATGAVIGKVAKAGADDLAAVIAGAEAGLRAWSSKSPMERAAIMRRAGDLLRERANDIAAVMTLEQGKPVAQALAETLGSADSIDWYAEQGKTCFGQFIPGRSAGTHVVTRREPVGIVAAFSPWNFPVSQAVRKLAAALGAGCSIVLKGPEEAPASCAALVRAFVDAGVPAGAVSLVYGEPSQISDYLIAHPSVRAVSFTGSVPVGKHLASLAGRHMKRCVMELGGHAPVIVCADADLDAAAAALAAMKFANAGQICIAPSRFLIERAVYEPFLERFAGIAKSLKVGDGAVTDSKMGPLATGRRLAAMQEFVDDALECGARLLCGGSRIGDAGFFFSPTVLADVPVRARIMNEEPFGPIAAFSPFDTLHEAITEANRLPFGLAAYAFTSSIRNEGIITDRIEAGMLAVNRVFQSSFEAPFGGVKDSGYGTEGGTEAILNFLNTKMVTRSFA